MCWQLLDVCVDWQWRCSAWSVAGTTLSLIMCLEYHCLCSSPCPASPFSASSTPPLSSSSTSSTVMTGKQNSHPASHCIHLAFRSFKPRITIQRYEHDRVLCTSGTTGYECVIICLRSSRFTYLWPDKCEKRQYRNVAYTGIHCVVIVWNSTRITVYNVH